jgi:AAA domain-containing protein
VHSRVLRPTDRLRYAPGSLLFVVCASSEEAESFLQRVFEDRTALLSLARVRSLLAGRVGDEDLDARAQELLRATVEKRLGRRQAVVIAAQGLSLEEREPLVRLASELGRPRHLILLETARERVREEDAATLNELRRALDAGELGAEGFQTALRLGGGSAEEVKRIEFRALPRED